MPDPITILLSIVTIERSCTPQNKIELSMLTQNCAADNLQAILMQLSNCQLRIIVANCLYRPLIVNIFIIDYINNSPTNLLCMFNGYVVIPVISTILLYYRTFSKIYYWEMYNPQSRIGNVVWDYNKACRPTVYTASFMK